MTQEQRSARDGRNNARAGEESQLGLMLSYPFALGTEIRQVI